MAKKKSTATKTARPSASMATAPPIISFGILAVLAVLAVVGILGMVLVMINPVLRMMAYVILSGAVVYSLAKVIKVKSKHKPLYFMGSFFALLTLMIVAPAFMSLFPATSFATTGEAALAQIDAGAGATQSQILLSMMPIICAGTLAGIAAGRAKTSIQLAILSLVAVLISIFIIFALLLV